MAISRATAASCSVCGQDDKARRNTSTARLKYTTAAAYCQWQLLLHDGSPAPVLLFGLAATNLYCFLGSSESVGGSIKYLQTKREMYRAICQLAQVSMLQARCSSCHDSVDNEPVRVLAWMDTTGSLKSFSDRSCNFVGIFCKSKTCKRQHKCVDSPQQLLHCFLLSQTANKQHSSKQRSETTCIQTYGPKSNACCKHHHIRAAGLLLQIVHCWHDRTWEL
jgi:hypothetical protein